jgi:hypothetical protein
MRLVGPSIHEELKRSVQALAADHDMQERFLPSRGYHIFCKATGGSIHPLKPTKSGSAPPNLQQVPAGLLLVPLAGSAAGGLGGSDFRTPQQSSMQG